MTGRTIMLVCGLALANPGHAQAVGADGGPISPIVPTREVVFEIESGLVRNDGREAGVVYQTQVQVPGASWIRLKFDDVLLSGTPFDGDQSYLRITSLLDGAQQTLNMVHVAQWDDTSAYFNGDTVLVELIASPGTGDNHLSIIGAWASDEGGSTNTICDGRDDRVQSDDPRAARYMPIGCTGWLIDDAAHCFITAGHCVTGGGVMEFNVPLSNGDCSLNHPPPEDQYAIDNTSRQWTNGGTGNDWGYLGVFPNSITGLTPYEAQGSVSFILQTDAPPAQNDIRITGYGTSNVCVLNQAQKTHVGPYVSNSGTRLQYRTDTTGGNSGSPVIYEPTGEAIGVHTHGGCSNGGGANTGTSVENSGWLNARANPQGVCMGPPGPPTTELFIAASQLGEIGAIDPSDETWGVAATTGLDYDAMAFDRTTRTFYLISSTGPVLYAMRESDYTITTIGTISGASRLHGAAFDPSTGRLFAIDETTGQLYEVDTTTAQATPIGDPHGGLIGALAFHEQIGALYGIDDVSDTSDSRLVLIDTGTGFRATIGSLGRGIRDVDGLSWRKSDGRLYAFNDANDRLYTVDTATGQATFVSGVDRATFGPSFGMAAGSDPNGCAADIDGNGTLDADDFFAYLDLFSSGDGRADLDANGVIDADDFFLYLDLFAAGC